LKREIQHAVLSHKLAVLRVWQQGKAHNVDLLQNIHRHEVLASAVQRCTSVIASVVCLTYVNTFGRSTVTCFHLKVEVKWHAFHQVTYSNCELEEIEEY
jgi:hypothetical protein